MSKENFENGNIEYSNENKDFEEIFEGVNPPLSKEKKHRLEQIDECLNEIKGKIIETEKELTDGNIRENERLVDLKKELEKEKDKLLNG